MAVYTGNNGRIYIARSETSGLTGTRTVTIKTGQSVAKNQTVAVFTVRGEGRGARMRAGAAVTTTQSSRSVTFTVVTAGDDYASTDVVYLAKYSKNTLVRITGNFSVGTTNTRGIDNEREIINDNYRIAKIRNWTYNSNSEVVETTALGDVTKTFAPSVTSGEGSATLMFYEDNLNSYTSERQKDIYELVDILFPRSAPPRVIMNLAVDGGISVVDADELQKTNFLFNAYITSASVAVSYGEVVTVDTSFTVDGPLMDVPWRPGVDRL